MSNYQKIATIVLRCLACYILMFVLIEWAIIASGTLLVNFSLFRRSTIAFEVRSLESLIYLIAGLALYAKSKSLANYIVREFQDE